MVPVFTKQNMSYIDPSNGDIYSVMTYDDLLFWTENPDEVFEMKVKLDMPTSTGGILTIPVRDSLSILSYFQE